MAVPKQKKSKSKVRTRRSRHIIKPSANVTCKQCGSVKISHTACAVCGTYNGKQVLDVEKREKRKERRLKSEEEEDKE